MAKRSTKVVKADRGGMSRSAFVTSRQGPRRTSNDDLLNSVLGDQATHFRDHPLDGAAVIGSMPKMQPGTTMPTPDNPPAARISADDDVTGKAEWFKHGGREGEKTSVPADAPVTKPKPAPSIASAATEAAMGLAADAALGQIEVKTGLPGEDYGKALDAAYNRPPSTFLT